MEMKFFTVMFVATCVVLVESTPVDTKNDIAKEINGISDASVKVYTVFVVNLAN